MKNQRESINEFVEKSSKEELTDIIQSLLSGTRAGIAGMSGESLLIGCSKPKTKKEAIESALSYCEIVNKEASKKIFTS